MFKQPWACKICGFGANISDTCEICHNTKEEEIEHENRGCQFCVYGSYHWKSPPCNKCFAKQKAGGYEGSEFKLGRIK